MKKRIEALLERFGQTVTVNVGGTNPSTVRAFVRLVSTRNRETFKRTWTGLGEVPPGKILYLGPATPALTSGMVLQTAEVRYLVRRCAGVKLGNETLYQWGLLSREGA